MAEPPAKRRRTGGINQRIAALKREDALDNPGSCTSIPSELADSFLKKWAWGQLSPQDVQEYSAKACRDFRAMQIEPPPDLDFFRIWALKDNTSTLVNIQVASFYGC